MLPAAGNETFGVNSDPRPRHISPEKSTYLDNNAGRESLRMKIIFIYDGQLYMHILSKTFPIIYLFVIVKVMRKQIFHGIEMERYHLDV